MKNTPTHFDVLVIGGGAAGLMAAGRAAERGKHVLLLEKNTKLGKKLSISGGGRCNITNAEEDLKVFLSHYGAAEQFLYSAFSEFGVANTFAFFESHGLPLKVEARKRAFPVTEKALDVVRVLASYDAQGKVDIRLGTSVQEIVVAGGMVQAVIAHGVTFTADAYILATGGVSHPETGSTGDGFRWLQNVGHTVIDPTPTIVPLRTSDAWVHALSGKVLPGAKITFFHGTKKKHTATGDILLTHFGLSGPVILNSAGKVADLLHEGPVTACVDLFPTLDIGQLDMKLHMHLAEHKNKMLRNTLAPFLPVGTADKLITLVPGIDPEKKTHSITRAERRAMVDAFKALPVTISGLMGYDKAVVADGGVPLSELDMRTMRSLRCTNLFVVGDLLHITRPSGGYSLQLCWTTGYVAGNCT